MQLKDKIVVVAGASGGIGREISKVLAREGARVFLVARNEIVLKGLKESIEEHGGRANIYIADLTSEASTAGLAKFLEKEAVRVDILFNAAGIGVYKKFSELEYDEWKKSFSVNVDAAFLTTHRLLHLLAKSENAYVISMGSGMGKVALPGRSAYCASKFALRGLMLSIAKEYSKTNIHFVHLILGSVLTSFGPLTLEDKILKQKKGKKYLDTVWLAHHIVTKIKRDSFEPETPIYPRHYFEESKKGKT